MNLNLDASDWDFAAAGEVASYAFPVACSFYLRVFGKGFVRFCVGENQELPVPFEGYWECRGTASGFDGVEVEHHVAGGARVLASSSLEEGSDIMVVEPSLNQMQAREDPRMAQVMRELISLRSAVHGMQEHEYVVHDDDFGEGHVYEDLDEELSDEDETDEAASGAGAGAAPASGDDDGGDAPASPKGS